jgi:hypothetical protein
MAPPSEWGPPAWAFIFSVIDEMDEYPSDTEYYRMFFESLKGVLPCEKCRYHYSMYVSMYPPPVWSREATRAWASKLREDIRKRNEVNRQRTFLDFFKI